MAPLDEVTAQRIKAAFLSGCDVMLRVLDGWIADAQMVVLITTSEDARIEYERRVMLLQKIRSEMVAARGLPS